MKTETKPYRNQRRRRIEKMVTKHDWFFIMAEHFRHSGIFNTPRQFWAFARAERQRLRQNPRLKRSVLRRQEQEMQGLFAEYRKSIKASFGKAWKKYVTHTGFEKFVVQKKQKQERKKLSTVT